MRFIIEGPDCSGKTTLAKALYFRLATHKYVHSSLDNGQHCQRNVKGQITKHVDNLFHSHLDTLRLNKDIVIDRHWPSELVYGHIFREKLEYNISDMRRHANIYKPVYIGCLPSWEAVKEKFEERKATEDFETVDRVYNMYARLFQQDIKFRIFNYENQKLNNFITEVLNVRRDSSVPS
tara:strand:+ start:5740 stop:6276 length:537 start_codon:yes stop_codon:yes gene_type:complete